MKNYNYNYLIVYIGEDGEDAYKAVIPKFPEILAMADTVEELHEAVMECIDITIKELKKKGLPIPSPDNSPKYNGKVLLRIPPEIHEQLCLEAQANQTSLNKYITSKLA